MRRSRLVTRSSSRSLFFQLGQRVAPRSPLVTHPGPVAHSPGGPPARPAPGPHARGRGSRSGCGVWPASAPGSPPCSPCGTPAPSSTAGGAGCAGQGGTVARSSDTCVVFAWSSAGVLQPPMMRTSTPDRDVARRRAEEDEEAFTGSFSKKTPPKKTAVSRRWNHYTFTSVLAETHARVRPARMLLWRVPCTSPERAVAASHGLAGLGSDLAARLAFDVAVARPDAPMAHTYPADPPTRSASAANGPSRPSSPASRPSCVAETPHGARRGRPGRESRVQQQRRGRAVASAERAPRPSPNPHPSHVRGIPCSE